MAGCPIWTTCNASVCPLLATWPSAYHRAGEKVCRYLLASGKPGAAEHYAEDPVFPVVLGVSPVVGARFPDIARRVEQAARRGFNGGNEANLSPRPVKTPQ